MKKDKDMAADLIESGRAVLGIEFGSTRIKGVLVGPDTKPLASGAHTWENKLEDGVWTYAEEDIWRGLADCYVALAKDVQHRFGITLEKIAALGVSGMMHGYVALDQDDQLLVPFRTWRNNITGPACAELTPLLQFSVPQRWSIAHLYQSVIEEQPHVPRIARLTTLAGYVHLKLTGEHSLGVGEASGMFPIDPQTKNWDEARLGKVEDLLAKRNHPWKLRGLLPRVLLAGEQGGQLTREGARLLDPSGLLESGIAVCPPEGDAGTGMVATNAVRPRCGNVSAGTSVFAMIVLERGLSQVHDEIDIVTTPDGSVVAMAHANNGSSDLDAWVALFGRVARVMGAEVSTDQLYAKLLPLAKNADRDAGGLLNINYVSGEHVTGFSEGRPLFARTQTGRLTLENFMRSMCFSSLCAMRTGMNILTEKEGVVIDEIRGHGGFFKGDDTGQRMMAAALNVPVSIPETAGEGGAWGMALLAAFMLETEGQSLADYLDSRIADTIGPAVQPAPDDVQGFIEFFERHKRGLSIEREAVNVLF